ncbi:PAS domain S-box protein [Methanosalsum zhilinae]|nr:PAS domain S-box protein [Methanosalsum zhilinae]
MISEAYTYCRIILDENGFPCDYEFLEVNPAFERMTELKASDIKGKMATELFLGTRDEDFDWIGLYGEVALTGSEKELEKYFSSTGRVYRINVYSPEKYYFVTLFTDISGTDERYHRLAENLGDIIYRYDFFPERGFSYVSQAAASIIGYTPEEHYQDPDLAMKVIHPEDRELFESYVRGEFPIDGPITFRWIHKNGSTVWIEQKNIPVYGPEGNLIALEGVARDISQRKETEKREKHLKQVLMAIRNVNQLITKETDPEVLIEKACGNLTETLGYYNAWIALMDDDQNIILTASSGFDNGFEKLESEMAAGKYPVCMQKVLERDDVIIIDDHLVNCKSCPLEVEYIDHAAMCYRLQFADKIYGIITVSVPVEYSRLKEEHHLFKEVADDLGFALHKIEMEKKRRWMEEELRNREEKLKKIFEIMPVGLWFADEKGQILLDNPAGARIWGGEPVVKPEDSETSRVHRYPSGEELRPDDWALVRTLNKGEKVADEILEIDSFDAKRKIIFNYTAPIFNEQEDVEGAVIVSQDITDLKETERMLKERIKELICISAVSQDMVKNMSVEEFCVRTADHLSKAMQYPEMASCAIEIDGSMYSAGESMPDMDNCLHAEIMADGDFMGYLHVCYLQNKPFLLPDEQNLINSVAYMIGTWLEKKQTQKSLMNSDRIFRHAQDMLCIAGFDGYFKVLNPSWSKTLGWSTEELLSRPWIEFVHPDDRRMTEQAKTTLVDGQEIYQLENRYMCSDGTFRWLSWNSYPYREENIMFGVARDITGQKRREERLEMVNRCLLDLTGDFTFNVNSITSLAGELLGGSCALYNRYDRENHQLVTIGKWNTPPDFQDKDTPEGHICYDAIIQGNDTLYISDISQTKYAWTDPNVKKYDIVSYAGHVVKHESEPAGILCVVFTREYHLTEDDRRLLGILASALGSEENRFHYTRKLRENEQRFRKVAESVADGIWDLDLKTSRAYFSDRYYEMLGYSPGEFEPSYESWKSMIHPDDIEYAEKALLGYLEGDIPEYNVEFRMKNKSGGWTWIQSRGKISQRDEYGNPQRIIGSHIDITEHKKLEEMNKNELIVKEVHHRVKNNLQVIASLLNMQSRNFDDEKVKAAFKDSQNRVKSMSLAHEKLYGSENLASIEISDYIKSLVNYIFQTYDTGKGNIKIHMSSDTAYLSMDIIVPLALILNEIITNSLKHAFPDEREGTISVDFRVRDDECLLQVSDDGVGISSDFDIESSNSLGLRVVNMLIQQLQGTIERYDSNGTDYVIRFKK